MSFKCGIISLIILLNITGSLAETLRVTCSPQTICALRESTVTLQCSHSNTTIKPQYSFWFSPKQRGKWRNEEDPEDLALDSDYAGRVRYTTSRYRYSSSTNLTISDLRERDSGEYHLMIITETGQKYSSSTAVTLTVSDLLLLAADTDIHTKRTLNCSTSCRLTSKPSYYGLYRNGKYVDWTSTSQRALSVNNRTAPGSYMCSASSHTEIHSNTVCINDENCWSVTYSDRRVCALKGSSVDFPCTYSYPRDQTVNKTFWHYFRTKVEPTDLSVEEQFAGRVEFLGDKERNCTLRMRNVRKSDSGEYYFRFITDTAGGSFSGYPGVILSVTDLQVKASPTTKSDRQTVTLTCISTCTLPYNPTYIWYKDGNPVTNKPTRYNKLYLESARTEDVLQYSCALGALEAPGIPVKNTGLMFIIVGVSVFLALILITGLMWRCFVIKRKEGAERSADVQTPNPGNDTYTALNPTTMSSDYDTLTHVRSSSSEMYSSLNPATMMPDYDTLTNVTSSPKNPML